MRKSDFICSKKTLSFCDYCGVQTDESEKEHHILGACPESIFNCENCEEMFKVN